MLEVRMKAGSKLEVADLSVVLPPHLKALSPLARSVRDGLAFMEFVAVAPGIDNIEFLIGNRAVGTKLVAAGEQAPRSMQPERVSSFFASWLWPAELTFPPESPIDSVKFAYPDRNLGPLPGGAFGVLLTFLLASLLFGVVALKPLNIQI